MSRSGAKSLTRDREASARISDLFFLLPLIRCYTSDHRLTRLKGHSGRSRRLIDILFCDASRLESLTLSVLFMVRYTTLDQSYCLYSDRYHLIFSSVLTTCSCREFVPFAMFQVRYYPPSIFQSISQMEWA
jgi:hypothetical protein